MAALPPAGPHRTALGRPVLGAPPTTCRSRSSSIPAARSGPARTRRRASASSCSSSSSRPGLVDLGCGSGVLAVAAAKLGFAPVIALDHDEAAVEAARANATANGVEVDVRLADVLVDPLPDVEVAVANIARDPVEQAAEPLRRARRSCLRLPRGRAPVAAGLARTSTASRPTAGRRTASSGVG